MNTAIWSLSGSCGHCSNTAILPGISMCGPSHHSHHCDFMKILKTPLARNKMLKSSYLPQMPSDQNNNGTLFSSTLKVEEGKVH